MPTLLIALFILALHIFLCFRKHWAWGGLVPALTLLLMIASPFVLKILHFGKALKPLGCLNSCFFLDGYYAAIKEVRGNESSISERMSASAIKF